MPEPDAKTLVVTPADFIEPPKRPKPHVPDHELIRPIGSGAYGEVWLAKNVVGTQRAVKVVHRDSFKDEGPYEREYRGLKKFEPISRSNDGFVDILQIGRNDQEGCFYCVMELADDAEASDQYPVISKQSSGPASPAPHAGALNTDDCSLMTSYSPKTLRSEIRNRGRLPFEECLQFALSLNLALGHLHRHGLIHRDIKPSNIVFIGGIPKLADIGLVTEFEEARSFVGTEGFIPPEGPNSPQADIYSLGKVIYEMSMGKDRTQFPEPFTALGQAPDSHELEELNTVIVKACAPDPRERYQSAEEMHVDLALLHSGKSVKSKHLLERRLVFARKAGALVGAVATVAVAAFLYQQFQTREARRLAQAETFQRTRAEGLLNTLQLKEAEHFFESDEAGRGVAYLARRLRQNPSNHLAAARLMSALTDRSFALPLRTFELPGNIKILSPDGLRFLFWAQNDTNGVVWLQEVAAGEMSRKSIRHENVVNGASFSPNNRWVATASVDGTARVWDAATGEPASAPLVHDGPVRNLAFSLDSQTLVTLSGPKAHVWRVPLGEPVMSPIQSGSAHFGTVEFSPDGGRILTLAADSRLALWDARSGSHLMNLEVERGNAGWGVAPGFGPDGSHVAAAIGAEVFVWDAQTGKVRNRLRHEGAVTTFQFSPDGLRIVAGDKQRQVRVWDVRTGQLLILPIVLHMEVGGVKFDPTGERILSQAAGRLRVWDSRTGQPVTEWLENSWGASFTPDGANVMAVSYDDAVFYDVRPGMALNLSLRHRGPVLEAKFSASGVKVVTAAKGEAVSDHEAVIWDAATGDLAAPRIKYWSGILDVELSPDERSLVTASPNGQARIWDARAGALFSEPLRHSASVASARYNSDGRMIVTGSSDHTARVWDVQTGRPLTDPLMHPGEVRSVEFSPDGRRILTLASEPSVVVPTGTMISARIWDITAGTSTELASRDERITDAHFSPDGKRVVGAFFEKKALIWDSETGRVVVGPLQHQGRIWSARFSPDGRRIVTASTDQTARIWDAATGKLVGEPLVHEARVQLARFSSDSRRVITVSDVGHIARVWDAETGRPLTERLRHGDWVTDGEFSPDGRRLVTASKDGTARIWELPPADVPVPDWLLDLADAVPGNRLLDQDMPEEVRARQLRALKQRILASPATDRYTAWAKWFLSDRLERGTSLNSRVTGHAHLAHLVEWSSVRTLREALLLSPTNAAATARLAREILGKSPKEYPHKEQVAEFLAERALKLDPQEPQGWWAKAEVLKAAGRPAEALQTLDRALALAPGDLELWQIKGQWLEKAGRDEAALLAYSKAVALVEAPREIPVADSETAEARKTALLTRAATLARLGRHDEATADNLRARGIPPRDPQTARGLLDLSSCYNHSRSDNGIGPAELSASGVDPDLGSLPRGVHHLAGVPFDLRGAVRVGTVYGGIRTGLLKYFEFPTNVSISLDRKCRRLHFLHAAWTERDEPIGRYVVRYEKGGQEEVPITMGKTVGNWQNEGGGGSGGEAEVAWTGVTKSSLSEGAYFRLFRLAWENPRPLEQITSIELELLRDSSPRTGLDIILLLAITVQDEPTPAFVRQPQSQTVAEGGTAVFNVKAESAASLAYQWQFNGADLAGATNAALAIQAVTREQAGAYTVQVRNAFTNSVLVLSSDPAALVVRMGGLSFGALRRETFLNISGAKLSDLTNQTRFPNRPDAVDFVHQFEAPSNFAEDYGVRLSGFLVPPKTGVYRFYLNSDEEGALFLSTNESPELKRRIAHEPDFNGDRLWTARHQRPKQENISAPIPLEAGRRYYVEALMKEDDGGDNLAVAWQMPGEPPPENLSPPIPGRYLAVPDLEIKQHPQPQTVRAGDSVTFDVQATSEVPLVYQWLFNESELPGATNSTLAIPVVARQHAGTYRARIWRAAEGQAFRLVSRPATLVFSADGLGYGAVRKQRYLNIPGMTLAELTNHSRFPDQPDDAELVYLFEIPSHQAENYGVRLSGFLLPPETGDYRFHLTSDDEGVLFLSPNESPGQKRQEAHVRWTNAREWIEPENPRFGKQANVSAPLRLEAGHRYYIEALMKGGPEANHLSVTWQMPGQPPPQNGDPPIPGTYLAVPAEWAKTPPTPLVSDRSEPGRP